MKKMKKVLLPLLSLLFVAGTGTALASCTGRLEYKLNVDGASYRVTYYGFKSVTEIVIPETYNDLPVTSIGEYAFSGCSRLTSITIPDSVTSIGGYAFNGCSSLESITIPNSVTGIWQEAFNGCSALTSITIPNSVTWIGDSAFFGCSSLESITIENSVTSIGYEAFYDTAYYNDENNWENNVLYIGKHLIEAKTTLSGAYSIKDGTLTIANWVFEYCSSLTGITIPDSVTSIGDSAFFGCSSLESITIPDSVILIGSGAFYECSSLTSVTFENTSGWYFDNVYGRVNISSSSLSDPATAAEYLTSTYCTYYWKRG